MYAVPHSRDEGKQKTSGAPKHAESAKYENAQRTDCLMDAPCLQGAMSVNAQILDRNSGKPQAME